MSTSVEDGNAPIEWDEKALQALVDTLENPETE